LSSEPRLATELAVRGTAGFEGQGRERGRAARGAAPPATYPIVLAHGIAPFDAVFRRFLDETSDPQGRTQYFRGIRSVLLANGFRAHHSRTPFAKGVGLRAAALRAEVERVLRAEGAAKVHIIGHSMGGLDARHMLFEHRDSRIHEKIASLSTLGTPHFGTSVADWGVAGCSRALALLAALGIDALEGFRDLTTAACREFDRRAEDFERNCGVRFQTFAGTQPFARVFAGFKPFWLLIQRCEGANDGMVARTSAIWRPEYLREEIDADHINQIGWWDPDERGWGVLPHLRTRGETRAELELRIRALYVRIAHDLAKRFALQ
jgi:triacylglycerol lipase